MTSVALHGESDPELAAALRVLLERFDTFAGVRNQAAADVSAAHSPLFEAYRDVTTLEPKLHGHLSELNVDLDGRTPTPRFWHAIETAAVHKPATPSSLAWNRTLERELRDKINRGLHSARQRFDQLERMRRRGPLGQRQKPPAPRELAVDLVAGGFSVCAICDRDTWTLGGEDLVIAGTHDPVCWLCGDEHDSTMTASVLADAVHDAEQWIAGALHGYLEHWIDLLQRLGMPEASATLRSDCERHQRQVREAKAAGLGNAETWLSDRPL